MKRKSRKISLLVVFALLCCMISSMTAAAADERIGTVVDGSLLTDAAETQGTIQKLPRGVYLGGGSGRLRIDGVGKVSISGSTTCYRICDKVKVTLYLQRLSGGDWVTVATLATKTATNASYVSNSGSYSVTSGYYYRVLGTHTAMEGSTTESAFSYSDGIWVY